MKTYSAKEEEVTRDWHLLDARGKIVGRMATNIADLLRGKHKPIFTPHVDTGDFVVVVNAKDVMLTGNKFKQKTYWHHSGYPGGIKSITAEKLLEKKPEDVIRYAVKGMLPKNRLGRQMIKKLKIYAGNDHPHQAQNPVPPEIK